MTLQSLDQPDWLTPVEPQEYQPKTNRELREQQFEIAFERVMELICEGHTLESAIKSYSAYPFALEAGAFNVWIHRDADRKRRYLEAKEFRTEVWAGRAMRIADGTPDTPDALPEDVQRSRLRVDTIFKLLAADNRKVYAPSQSVDVTTTNISITAALDAAKNRVQNALKDVDLPAIGMTYENEP